MKARSRSIVILTILFGYILLQFVWWEILLVKQNGQIISEKQKLIALSTIDDQRLKEEINSLHHKKKMQTIMIVSEGTVFLLLLLFGIYKIKQSMDKEQELNSSQKNFFLSITHELKTPIAATKLQLQTLQKQKLDEDTRQQLLNNALQETERLNILIDNILFASRLESNEFIVKKERINLSDFTREILERYYKNQLVNKELNYHIQPGVYSEVDVHAFPSVITNLVDNAIKYSPVKKEIELDLSADKNNAIIKVADKGIGISEPDRLKVFSKFYRAGNEEIRNTKGTGLGLYIVNYIILKHGAKIRIDKNEPTGTIFEIQLQLA